MLIIGMSLAFGSYSLLFWGYSMIRGYDLSLKQIMTPGPYTGTWPPAIAAIPDTPGTGAGGAAGGSILNDIPGVGVVKNVLSAIGNSGGVTTKTNSSSAHGPGTGNGGTTNAGTGAGGPNINK